jgi:hypothetical protein
MTSTTVDCRIERNTSADPNTSFLEGDANGVSGAISSIPDRNTGVLLVSCISGKSHDHWAEGGPASVPGSDGGS